MVYHGADTIKSLMETTLAGSNLNGEYMADQLAHPQAKCYAGF